MIEKMVEKTNRKFEMRSNYSKHILLHADFRATNQVPPETALRTMNGEINETIAAGRIRASNLKINPYFAIQTIGTVNRQR